MVLYNSENIKNKKAIKARKKLNKTAFERFRRFSSMQQKKTAMRFILLTAAEFLLILVLFLIV